MLPTKNVLLRAIILTLLTGTIQPAHAFEEADVFTGEKNRPNRAPSIEQPALPEPVYLEEKSEYKPSTNSESPQASGRRVAVAPQWNSLTTNLYLGLSANNTFDARVGLHLPVLESLRAEGSMKFFSQHNRNDRLSGYGPEVAVSAYKVYRQFFEPIFSLGLGYQAWRSEEDDGTLSEADHSMLAYAALGLHCHFSKNFGLKISQRITGFTNRPHRDMQKQDRLPNPMNNFEAGFVARF